MDTAFRTRRGRWELDGHELGGGSVVEVNACDRRIRARVKYDNDRLRDRCLLLNGEGMLLMSPAMKPRPPLAAAGERND